jgi:hypothetical protein
MKLENFTTAKCIKCGWTGQFQPGKEYKAEEFECNCNKLTPLELLKSEADKLGIKYPTNIGEKSLEKKINEVRNGNLS